MTIGDLRFVCAHWRSGVLIGDLEALIDDLEALIDDLEALIGDLEALIDDLEALIGDLESLIGDLSLVSIGWVKALSMSVTLRRDALRLVIIVQAQSFNLIKHGSQIGRRRCQHVGFGVDVFVMGKSGQIRIVRGIIVAENECGIGALIMITVHQTRRSRFKIHQFAEVQQGVVGKINIASN